MAEPEDATPTDVQSLISAHPTNPVRETEMFSESNKSWADQFPPISRLRVHTRVLQDGTTVADFEPGLISMLDDDTLRLAEKAFPPNNRQYRLYSEEDGVTWFHTEVSNVVLAAFQRYPLLLQTSHQPPKHGTGTTKLVDTTYMVKDGNGVHNLVLGEFKRNLINNTSWQGGNLVGPQIRFSRELRGYAYMYECPQIYCFDHKYLLLLQFRAKTPEDIRRDCEADCWILPRVNPNGTPLRLALYRFIVQGLRRYAGFYRSQIQLGGLYPELTDFFSGQPRWRINNALTTKPFGFSRQVDRGTGAFYWVDENGDMLVDGNGVCLWDTIGLPIWSPT